MSEQARTPLSEIEDESVWDWSADVSCASQGAAARLDFRAYLARFATIESDVGAAELIFGELLANVVRHADGVGTFRLQWRDRHARLVVEDGGRGFRETPRRSLEDPSSEDGRGLVLMSRFALEISLGNRPAGGGRVEVLLPVERSRA